MIRVGMPRKYKPMKLSELPKPRKFKPTNITNHTVAGTIEMIIKFYYTHLNDNYTRSK